MQRKIMCQCGHIMEAKNDEKLFAVVREHVDDKHGKDPNFNYSDEEIRDMIAKKAYDA